MHRLTRAVAILALAAAMALAACSGQDDDLESAVLAARDTAAASSDAMLFADDGGMMADALAGGEMAMAAPAAPAMATMEEASTAVTGTLPASGQAVGAQQAAGRKIISTASMHLEVEDPAASAMAVEAMVTGLGGYVESLASYGDEDARRASLTLRVPQAQFGAALTRMRALGDVTFEEQGSEDVSEQYIDLEARLNSAQREEQTYLSLLTRSQNVADVLAIERELARVRADVERYQGQLDYLERRVSLSTIYVDLTPFRDSGPFVEPPFAHMTIEVDDVQGSAAAVRALIEGVGGEVTNGSVVTIDRKLRASIGGRVYSDDFRTAVTQLEGIGEVTSTEVTEPILRDDSEERVPSARLNIDLEEPEFPTQLVVTIAGIAVGVVLVAAVLALLVAALRRRRVASRAQDA